MPDFGRWTSNGGDPSLNEINRTDRFIEALSLEQPVYSTDPEEAELAFLLAGWRDDVRQAPMTGIINPREAVVALDRAVARNRPRLPLALVGSAAAAVLCLGGFGAAVYGSSPGDALYGLRGMIFGEQATRDVQVELASTELEQVQQLIEQGDWQAAQQKLQTLTTTVATVNDEAQKQQLVTQWQQLSVKVENQDPNATVAPDAPPPVFPEVTITPPAPTDTSAVETTPGSATPSEPTSPGESATPSDTSDTSEPSSETTVPSSPTPSTAPSSSVPTATSQTPTSTQVPTSTPTSSAAVQLPSPVEEEEPAEPQPTSVPQAPTSAPAVPAEPSGPSGDPARPPVTATTTVTLPTQAGPAQGPNGRGNGPGNGAKPAEPAQPKAPEQPAVQIPLLPGMGGN
ncbi:anti-sigma-D factor RsdA [Mycolicibacterium smegmatis]|uniref:Anti-sigma-D factor RsdA sigma factor binding region domain-containing protein n=4 Tax=Mycolicibacterium smegmatis TaxID=1772 RepID=A0QSU1_MYCS2|nr:anti-sigma-D factor RsdA [Mycolicibacterium smegmatis]ABK70453.1 conserved hypothetical protein [Mycolicibacterium smegmatis MC2 155]AFP38034.1 hypothetical protein MSMEI_1561 [Mycolicibacterium smegmatis MC2 155]AIU06830.1 hypothetical protein LJ00_07990 [Mycolicibacterium smegmatis MC2 155]AIU13455.1 hypothetical protein LI99_07990 [Mycolicibacterium smegmatis]AIU20079.1 hypothetical protein LI98_07990 [Mycolicibacterium smegmatis]